MKKILFLIVALVFAAASLSAQGGYLTRTLKVGIQDLEQPPFGAAAFADSAVTQSLTEDTWSVISEFVEIASNDLTVSDDTFRIQKNGGYAVDADLSFYYGATDTLQMQLFKNATAFGPKLVTTTGAVNSALSISTYVVLTQGDIVTLKIRNISDATDATIQSGSLFLRRIYK